MTPKASFEQPRPADRLLPRHEIVDVDPPDEGPGPPSMLASWFGRLAQACSPTGQGLKEWAREPAFFLAAVLVCVLITFLLKIRGDALEASASVANVRAGDAADNNARADNVAPAKPVAPAASVTTVEVVKQSAVAAPAKPLPRTIPLEEIVAINAAKPQINNPLDQMPIDKEGRLDALPAFKNGWGNRNEPDAATFRPDPVSGASVNELNQWQLRGSYRLPIDGPEISKVRRKLGKLDDVHYIEQQWWYPRTVEIPERHWRGRIAKLRFLIETTPSDLHRLAGYLSVVRILGPSPEHSAVIQVDAYFVSSGGLSIAIAAKSRPRLFAAGDSIARGESGQLAVDGPEIEAVRKALIDKSPGATIREVKWWPPRPDAESGHATSKLRYEANRDGDVKVHEIVFDHAQKVPAQAKLSIGLFPENDRRSLKLESPQK